MIILQGRVSCVAADPETNVLTDVGKIALGYAPVPALFNEPNDGQTSNSVGWKDIAGASFVGNVTIWGGVLITGDLCPSWQV